MQTSYIPPDTISTSPMEIINKMCPPKDPDDVDCKMNTKQPTSRRKQNRKGVKDGEQRQFVSLSNKLEIVKLFGGLQLAENEGHDVEEHQVTQLPERFALATSDKMFCSFCSCPFENRLQQKDHYKLDWHRFNLKQRIMGKQPILEEDFEKITDNVSSISGSESSTSESDVKEDDLSPTSFKKISFPHARSHAGRQSETESDDEASPNHRRQPKVHFRNASGHVISVHRCLLHGKKNIPSQDSELSSLAKSLPERLQWLILMAGGGHFAGAVFHGETVVVHKTFHRYTVRAKRGTSQGLHDKQAGKISKSVGANLRRYNEAALIDDIHQVLKSWEEHINACTHVFLRAPSHNRTIFIGGKNAVFDKNDLRVVNIPFATRRPTFRELKRVQEILSTVQIYEPGTDINSLMRKSPTRTEDFVGKNLTEEASPDAVDSERVDDEIQRRKCQEPVPQEAKTLADLESDDGCANIELVFEEVTTSTDHLKEFDISKKKRRKRKPKVKDEENKQENKDPSLKILQYDAYTACKTGNTCVLKDLLSTQNSNNDQPKSNTQSDDAPVNVDTVKIINEALDASNITLLHVAAETGQMSIVRTLLEAGADPTLRNSKGLPPFCVSKDKETRNEFRRYMGAFPDQHDYAKAQIPSPLTPEMELEKAAKNAERKKAQKKIKKTKQKEQREEQKKQDEEEQKKKWFMSLSDREKRAVAAERRLMKDSSISSGALRCWLCGKTVAGKPFSYLEFNFCSIECLKKHKASNK
ncbi:ankyrin repeat and zinc finger domain-containing protein 1-like [Anneissia japonica]|uniref:ankyrin repeat and zinc finger domain-containing protein 1-like n=1 Tax=Anneissia japonica TaxID=1529436 RepID=UPI00142576FD|nr:ankyrin repeat and zinc finger domain-containing protein 1-like [Anneissia japonica]